MIRYLSENTPNGPSHHLHSIFGLSFFIVHLIQLITVLTNDFFTEFCTYFEIILLSKEHLVIAGDFNIHVDVPNDCDSVKLLDLLQSVGLQQHFTEPTKIQGHTHDLIITPSSDDILSKVPLVDRFISDHASVYCTPLPDRPYVTTKKVAYRKLNPLILNLFSRTYLTPCHTVIPGN